MSVTVGVEFSADAAAALCRGIRAIELAALDRLAAQMGDLHDTVAEGILCHMLPSYWVTIDVNAPVSVPAGVWDV